MVSKITDENLLAELEDLLRRMPPRDQMQLTDDETLGWCGRVRAVFRHIGSPYDLRMTGALDNLRSQYISDPAKVRELLMAARHDLRMRTVGPLSLGVEKGAVFDYFDIITDRIEEARSDLLFVDRYLDKEFVSKYLVFVVEGVRVRLLTLRQSIKTLVPSVATFATQHKIEMEVRSVPSLDDLHDRFVLVDGASCYQSGASFKDGGRSFTVLNQVTDAFPAVLKTYEDLWRAARLEFPLPPAE